MHPDGLDEQVRDTIQNTFVLWLATVSPEGLPCLAPKELFTDWEDLILIADSTETFCFENLLVRPTACIGFVHALTGLGFQIHVEVDLVEPRDPRYAEMVDALCAVIRPDFPFETIYAARPTAVEAVPIPVIQVHPHRSRAQMITDRWFMRNRN